MIAYLAIAIGLLALVIAALPFIKKKEPEQPADFDGLEDLHRRLDGIALRMKSLEQKITDAQAAEAVSRSEEHTSELQSLMRISYAVFCLKKKKPMTHNKRHRMRCNTTKLRRNNTHI